MMMAIGLIGILIGIVLLNWLSFKGWSMCYVAIGAAVLVAVFNWMAPQQAYVETFMSGAANILIMTYPILLSGSLFAAVFSLSGAAVTIAKTLLRLFARKGMSGDRGCWVVATVSILFFTLMMLGGVDAMAVQIAVLPIIISLLRECNLTRRGIPLLLMAAYSVGAMPYAPHMLNSIPMSILGTGAGAFAIPGIFSGILGLVVCLIYSARYFIRMRKQGEVFHPSPSDPDFDDATPRPGILLSLLPLVVIFVLFNFAKLQVSICLFIACVLSVPLYLPWLRQAAAGAGVGETIKQHLNKAVATSGSIALSICAVVGFATVIQETHAFSSVVSLLVDRSGDSIFVAALIVIICAGITSNNIAGIRVGLSVMADKFLSAGVSAAALHRVAAAAAQTLDSLPISAGVVMAHQISGVKLKDGYAPVAVVSILIPLLRTLVLCLFYCVNPNWA